MQKPNSQRDYTSFEGSYQVFLPFNLEFQIDKDDPVRLLRHCIGGMDITALEKTYQRIDRNLASPRQMLAIIVYAGMNHIFSSRRIELACRRDINFMYLLEGKPVPDHTTIARFRSKHLASCIKELFAQMDFMLEDMGAISLQDIFIDGTKIESVANKYKFVWKKSVQKNQAKLTEKLPDFVDKAREEFSVSLVHGKEIHLHQLKKLHRKLKARQKEQGIKFVHGIGKRKTSLQKTLEQLDEFIARLKKYNKYLHIMGNRNSFAKTDTDATFMRMKEDAMKNGQLKPAYNIQYGTDSEFVTWATVGPQPTDTTTLIPFLQEMEHYTHKRYRNVVADSGYESEENYLYLETHQQHSFIKPSNYEKSKTRKWKQDIGHSQGIYPQKQNRISKQDNPLQLRKLQGLSGKKSVHTWKSLQNATGRTNQEYRSIQTIPAPEAGRFGTDNLTERHPVACKSQHSGRRSLCHGKSGYEFPPIPNPWEQKCPCGNDAAGYGL